MKTEDNTKSMPWRYTYRRILKPAIISLCILLIIAIGLWYQSTSTQIVVKHMLGSGTVAKIPQNEQWISAKPRMSLPLGSRLMTNQWSKVELHAGLGTQVWVNQDTKISIANNKPVSIAIEKGELFIAQWRLKSIDQVKTPAGIVTPIGTSYDIRVADNGNTQITVTDGKVNFTNKIGNVIIPAGYQSEADAKQITVPSTPTRVDTSSITDWVDASKKIIHYSNKTRKILAKEARALGLEYYNAQRYYDSLTTYQYAVELDPEKSSGYSNIGIVYVKLKQYKNAIVYCETALMLDSTVYNANARYNLVVSLVELGKYNEAKIHAEILVKQVPTDHAFSIMLAEIYRHLGYFEDAERLYRYGLTQSPCADCTQIAKKGLDDIANKHMRHHTFSP
ncbi:MAG: tetratricopeptide repeat protein [bacterium]